MRPLVFEKDPAFWFETLRCLSHVADGGADVGECLSTAVRIVEGDYDSWHDEWLATADRVAREAELGLGRGHRVSARGALLRPPTTTVRPSSSCMPTRTIPASTTRGSAYEDLTCPRTFIKFTAEEGAGAHCEAGAATLASARIYDWLDDVLLRR